MIGSKLLQDGTGASGILLGGAGSKVSADEYA